MIGGNMKSEKGITLISLIIYVIANNISCYLLIIYNDQYYKYKKENVNDKLEFALFHIITKIIVPYLNKKKEYFTPFR